MRRLICFIGLPLSFIMLAGTILNFNHHPIISDGPTACEAIGYYLGNFFCVILSASFLSRAIKWVEEDEKESIHTLSTNNTIDTKLVGLRGWLILCGIVIIFSLVAEPLDSFLTYREIIANPGWEIFKNHGDSFRVFLVAVILLHTISLALHILLSYMFFYKKRLFPKLFITKIIFSFIGNIINDCAINYILSFSNIAPEFDINHHPGIKFLSSAMWILYMLYSKRVKATFVH